MFVLYILLYTSVKYFALVLNVINSRNSRLPNLTTKCNRMIIEKIFPQFYQFSLDCCGWWCGGVLHVNHVLCCDRQDIPGSTPDIKLL